MEKLLTVEGLDVNVRDSVGSTPLMLAVVAPPAYYDMMIMLVNAGADMEIKDNMYGDTAACTASIYMWDNRNTPLKVSRILYSADNFHE